MDKLSPQEQRLYKLYGKLPTRSELLLNKKLKGGDRKFFDSGDYALSKAGKDTDAAGGNIDADIVSKRHADSNDIPHHSSFVDYASPASSAAGSAANSGPNTPLSSSPSQLNMPGSPIYTQSSNNSSNSSSTTNININTHSIHRAGSFGHMRKPSGLSGSPDSDVPPVSIPTVLPPRSPHAAPASLLPGNPSLSSANSHLPPVTAQVHESSLLLNETKKE